MAPEVLKAAFSYKADVWSMGIVMFEVFADEFPFEADVEDKDAWSDLFRRGANWRKFPAALQGTNDDAQNLCAKMLTVKESNRPTAAECLQHPWIRRNDRSNLSPYDLT